MSNKIVVLGPLPPPLGGVSIHIIRYIELLKTTDWDASAVSYTGTTHTGRIAKFREVLGMFGSIYLKINPGSWDVLHLHYGGLGYFLALAPLLAPAFDTHPLEPLSNYPAVARDMALVVDEAVSHQAIADVVSKAAPPELTEVLLFDTFRGEGIGDGKKSMAYSLVYRSLERNLTDEEANGFHDTVKGALRDKLGAESR